MALIVQKYGGTSVGSVERIGAVADRVARFTSDGHDVVVVVSAMSGETNRLMDLATQIQANPMPRELDALLSTGEKVTTALLSMALGERGVHAKSYSANQVGILTDSAHNNLYQVVGDQLVVFPFGESVPGRSSVCHTISR